MPGHPDGQNYAIWRGPYFEANPSVHIDSTHPLHAQGQVTNYASLIVNVFTLVAAGVTVVIHWWTDSTMTQQLDADTWDIPFSVTLAVIIPNLTNFVSIDITTTDAVGAGNIVEVAPTNTIVANAEYQVSKNIVQNVSQSIPANTTFTALLPFIAAGKGHFFFQDIAASTHLTFEVIVTDLSGARLSVLAEAAAPTTISFGDITLPDRPVAIQVVNSDVAPHNAGYSLFGLGR